MAQTIAIINCSSGNIHSVYKKLSSFNITTIVTADVKELKRADKVILPGVGHFDTAMKNIRALGIEEALHLHVRHLTKPVLGICLGMQILANNSEEGIEKGLGYVNAHITRFKVHDNVKYKVPHTGWNNVVQTKANKILQHITSDDEFYFVHAYHYVDTEAAATSGITTYNYPFVSAIEKENIFGVQFHPEKSHHAGSILFKNFISI